MFHGELKILYYVKVFISIDGGSKNRAPIKNSAIYNNVVNKKFKKIKF